MPVHSEEAEELQRREIDAYDECYHEQGPYQMREVWQLQRGVPDPIGFRAGELHGLRAATQEDIEKVWGPRMAIARQEKYTYESRLAEASNPLMECVEIAFGPYDETLTQLAVNELAKEHDVAFGCAIDWFKRWHAYDVKRKVSIQETPAPGPVEQEKVRPAMPSSMKSHNGQRKKVQWSPVLQEVQDISLLSEYGPLPPTQGQLDIGNSQFRHFTDFLEDEEKNEVKALHRSSRHSREPAWHGDYVKH